MSSALSQEQISILLQIINKTSFTGAQLDIIYDLKKTLITLLNKEIVDAIILKNSSGKQITLDSENLYFSMPGKMGDIFYILPIMKRILKSQNRKSGYFITSKYCTPIVVELLKLQPFIKDVFIAESSFYDYYGLQPWNILPDKSNHFNLGYRPELMWSTNANYTKTICKIMGIDPMQIKYNTEIIIPTIENFYLNDILFSEKCIAIHPYAFPGRDINIEHWESVIEFFISINYTVILLGTEKEDLFKKHSNIINLINKTNILEATYIIGNSKIFIGGLSLLHHIARNVGVDTNVICDNTNIQSRIPDVHYYTTNELGKLFGKYFEKDIVYKNNSTCLYYKPEINIVIGHYPFFNEIGKAINDCFQKLGYESYITNQFLANRVNFCLGAYQFGFIKKCDNTLYIMYQMEQFPFEEKNYEHKRAQEWFERINTFINCYDYVFDVSIDNVNFLKSKKYNNVFHLPVGYHHSFEFNLMNTTETYDFFFTGSFPERRQRILSKLLQKYKGNAVFDIFGEDRAKYILSSKINLNLHYEEHLDMFESLRIVMLLLSNKRFVLTEPIKNLAPFQNKIHLVTSTEENLDKTIDYYLTHEDERKQIAENGYNFVKTEYKLMDHLQNVLNMINLQEKFNKTT
jgi:ADP-heptose:LPS heptosyltransferase